MSNGFKKTISVSLGIMMILNSFIPSAVNAANDEKGNISDCVIAAKNEIVFTERSAEIGGSVAASGITVNSYGFHGSEEIIKIDGFCNSNSELTHIQTSQPSDDKKYDIIDVKNHFDSIEYTDIYQSGTGDSPNVVENTSVSVNDNIYANGDIVFDNVSFTGSGYVTSSGDMRLYMNTDTDPGDYCSFYSENGSIFVSGSKLTINGMLYAPSGNVYFDVKDLTLNGCVYADNIYFSGTDLTVRRNERAQAGAIEQLTVDAGEAKTAYIGEAVALQAASNYENTSYNWFSSDEGVELRNAGSANAEVLFSASGRYKLDLTGSYNGMTAEDSVVITVLSSVKKVYTTNEDFEQGSFTDTYAKNGSLRLSEDDGSPVPVTKDYEIGSNTGVRVTQSVSKDRLSAPSDSVDIDYTFEIPERVNDSEGASQISGTDFVFVYDNSGSMREDYPQAIESVNSAILQLVDKIQMGDRIAICNISNRLNVSSDENTINNNLTNKINCYPFIADSVSSEISFEKMKNGVRTAINGKLNTASYNAVNGISNALSLFEHLYGESYPSDRRHVIIYFGDTAIGSSTGATSYKKTINSYTQTMIEKNIVFNAMIFEELNKITSNTGSTKYPYKCIQDMAIATHGAYFFSAKESPTDSISENILKIGNNSMSDAAENIQLEASVPEDMLMPDSIYPKPSSIEVNSSGEAVIKWDLPVDTNTSSIKIHIPLKSDSLSDEGPQLLAQGVNAGYTDNKGIKHSEVLPSVILPKNKAREHGTWKAVYDSGTEDYQWYNVSWKALFRNDSDAAVYISAGNNEKTFSGRARVSSVDSIRHLKGRYLCIEAELTASSEGLSPEIKEIIITGGKNAETEEESKSIETKIYGTGLTAVNTPVDLYAVSISNERISSSYWNIAQEDKSSVIVSDGTHIQLCFSEEGDYTLTHHTETENGITHDEACTVIVDDTETEEYNGVTEYNYNVIITPDLVNKSSFDIRIEKNSTKTDLPDIAWAAVTLDCDKDIIYPLNADLENDGGKYTLKRSGTLNVVAYDWNGQSIPWYTEIINGEEHPVFYKTPVENKIFTSLVNTGKTIELPKKVLLNSEAFAYLESKENVYAYDDENYVDTSFISTGLLAISLMTDSPGLRKLVVEGSGFNSSNNTYYYEVVEEDTVPPVSWISFENSDNSTGHNVYASGETETIDFTVSGKDNVGIKSRKLTVDGAQVMPAETQVNYLFRFTDKYSFSIGSYSEGKHTVISEVTDTSGNVIKTGSCFVIGEDDLIKPEITLSYQGLIADNVKQYYAGSKPQITAIATDNTGIEKLTVSINGREYPTESGNVIFDEAPAVGSYEILVTASDKFGNTRTLRDTFEVIAEPDKTKPIITKADITPSIVSAGDKVTITVEAEDDRKLESVSVRTLRGETISLTDGKGEYIIKESEEPVFIVTAEDASGNRSEMQISCTLSAPLTQEQKKEYLSVKDETALSDSIKLVADELETPAAVYGFVKNSIRQEYYSFSRKGAAAALDQFGGNDIDTASLLISMLRYLGYPARYVNGKVTYTNEEILSMTGMTDLRSAIETFTFRNKNYTRYADRIVTDRTWTEVYVPATMCGIDKDANIWVALDGAYKSTEVTKADTKDGKQLFLKTNVQNDYTVLPIEPEFNIFAVSSRKASITDEQADTIRFSLDGNKLAEIKTSELAGKSVVLEYRPASSSDYSKYYKCEGMLWNMDLTNYRVVPTLLVGGEIAGTGKKTPLVDFNMSLFNPLSISYSPKSQKLSITGKSFFGDEVSSQLSPSGVYAIGIDLYNISGNEILETYTDSLNRVFLTDAKANSSQEDFCGFYTANQTGAVMAYLSKMYFSQLDVTESFLWEQGNYHLNKEIAVGIFGYMDSGIKSHLRIAGANSSIVNELDGNGTVFTDIIRNSVMIRYNDPHFESDSQAKRQRFNDFHRLMNIASYYEGQIWEDYFDDPGTGVSTVSALNKAKDEGIDIIFINSSTGSIDDIDFTGLDSSAAALVAGDINRYVSDGYSVMIHQKPVELGGWKGFGYYVFDPENTERTTYARINGSRNGGTYKKKRSEEDLQYLKFRNTTESDIVSEGKKFVKTVDSEVANLYSSLNPDPKENKLADVIAGKVIKKAFESAEGFIDSFEINARKKYPSGSKEDFAMTMGIGTARILLKAFVGGYGVYMGSTSVSLATAKNIVFSAKSNEEIYNEYYKPYADEIDRYSEIMHDEIDSFCDW